MGASSKKGESMTYIVLLAVFLVAVTLSGLVIEWAIK